MSFHTPSGNLFEDSSTIDLCGRSLPLLWLADPFDGRPVEKPLSNQACPTPSKTSLVSKRRYRELLAPARKDGSPCAGKEFVDVLTAIYLKVGESHVRWALVIILLLQKIDRHLKLLKNRFKRPLT
jgi:hypothetical protein